MSSRRRAPAPRPSAEGYVPHWPLAAGALALLLIAVIGGYTGGLIFAETAGSRSAEMEVVSDTLVPPPPTEEAVEEPSEEPSEPAHPAGIVPGTAYVLQNVHGGRTMDVAGASTDDGAHVHLWDRHDGENQQWRFVPVEGGFYEIEGVASGKILQVSTDASADPVATLIPRAGASNQHWTVVEAGEGVVRLVNRATGQALTPQDGSPDGGALIVHTKDEGHPHQQWRLLPLG